MAAITFPTSPSDGDTFETNGRIYIYSSTYDSWSSASSSGIFTGNVVTYSSATVFPTVGNTQGNFAFDRENLALYIWDGTEWDRIATGTVRAAAQGGGTNEVFFENDIIVTDDYTITSGKNAMSAGPITINTGVTVTVTTGSVWTIV